MNKWQKLFSGNNSSELNTFCDIVYYINLDTRLDRLESINKQLFNNKIIATRFSAICPTSSDQKTKINAGEIGCLMSHLKIMQDVVDKNYSVACILEDDIVFKEFFSILFSRFIENIPSNWDMLYLCGNNFCGLNKINECVFKTRGTLTTCAYIITKNMCEKVIDYIGNNFDKPIDSYLAELHKQTNTYVAVPSLAYQMSDYSDIQKRIVDYGFLY